MILISKEKFIEQINLVQSGMLYPNFLHINEFDRGYQTAIKEIVELIIAGLDNLDEYKMKEN